MLIHASRVNHVRHHSQCWGHCQDNVQTRSKSRWLCAHFKSRQYKKNDIPEQVDALECRRGFYRTLSLGLLGQAACLKEIGTLDNNDHLRQQRTETGASKEGKTCVDNQLCGPLGKHDPRYYSKLDNPRRTRRTKWTGTGTVQTMQLKNQFNSQNILCEKFFENFYGR